MMNLAKSAYEDGDITSALKFYSEIYKNEPENLEVLEGLARCNNRLKNYEDAAAYCRIALDIDKSLAWPHCILSYIYFYTSDIDSYKREASLALEKSPNDWEPNYLWGNLLYQEKKDDDALIYLEKAKSINPNNWFIHNTLSLVYLRQNNLAMHYDAIKEMKRIKPNSYDSFRFHTGKYFKFYMTVILIIHYGALVIAALQKQAMILAIPSIINILWILSGVFILFRPNLIEKKLGISAILIGVIQGLMILVVMKSLY